MNPTKTLAANAALVLCVAARTHAQIWIEPRDNDAGDTAATAQVCGGSGSLDGIQGVLRGDLDHGTPDVQDLFAIFISNPAGFSATTVSVGGGADFDTNLWLFGPFGHGKLGNRDLSSFSTFSQLTPVADDGTFILNTAGIYIIGVSGGSSRPTSAGGEIFSFLNPTELSGPDGPGGGGALNGWVGDPEIGVYFIELTGVSYVPSPGASALLAFAGFAAGRRRR